MKKLIAAAVAGIAIFAGTFAIAADDPIAARQALMKGNGASMGALGKMAKGGMAFDAAVALQALQALNKTATEFGALFPKGSETGMKTTAAPAIWSDMAGFDAAIAKFQTATSAALANPPKSKDDLGAIMGSIGSNCGGCHKVFRVKKG